MMKRARGGAKPLAEFTPELIAEALAARGLSEASLIADWRGDRRRNHCALRPADRAQWPPRAAKRDPEAPIAPATLVLRVDGAFALEAQHSAAVIVARVNAHLGWRCVEKIAFRQGPLPPLKEKRRVAPAPPRRRKRRRAPPPHRSRTTTCARPWRGSARGRSTGRPATLGAARPTAKGD